MSSYVFHRCLGLVGVQSGSRGVSTHTFSYVFHIFLILLGHSVCVCVCMYDVHIHMSRLFGRVEV